MNNNNLKPEVNQILVLLNKSKERIERRSKKYKLLKMIEEMLKEQVQS